LVSDNHERTWIQGFENRELKRTFGPKREEVEKTAQ
jgi:hypothetical protein